MGLADKKYMATWVLLHDFASATPRFTTTVTTKCIQLVINMRIRVAPFWEFRQNSLRI